MKLGEVYVEIYADQTKLTAGLNKAQKNVSASMKTIGRNMAIAGAAIVAGFGMAIRTAAKFEQSMANVASVAGATSEELKELSDYARKMGEQSVYSASQAADAMYYLASAGMNVNEIMGALEGTLALAAATQSDLATTSAAVAASLSQFALDAEGATRVANVYAAAISGSQATMEKLTTSMSLVGPMAHSMGMSIEEITGILMGLYNAGIPASTAATALRMAFVKLIEPTVKGTAALEGLKVSVVDSSGAMRPFKDIIDDLGIAGMTTADAMDIFGIRAGPAMMALVSQGTGAIQENVDVITDTNKAYEMAAMQIDTFEGAMKLLRSAFEELQITLVQDLMPSLKEFIEWVTEGIKKISDWMKENPKLTETIVKVTAAIGALMLVLGPLLIILPSLVKGFAILKAAIIAIGAVGSGPIGGLILGVGAVYLAFKNWDKIREIVDKIKNAVINKIKEWSASLNKWWDNIVANTDNKWILVADKIIKAVGDVYTWLVDNIGKWIESISGWWDKIETDTESTWNKIAGIIIDSAKAWMNFFAETLPGWILWVINLFDKLTGRFDEFQDRINKMTLAELNAEIEATTELLKGMKRGLSELKPGIEYDELLEAFEAEKKKLEELKERRVELIYFIRTGIELTYEEIQARKEVTELIKEEQEAVKALIEGQKEEIEGVGELLKGSEELSNQMKILTAEYELTNKTIEDTAKYYQDMLDVAEELVEVKEAEMDVLEEGTTKWDEAYLAYLAAQKGVKDLKEAIEELNRVQDLQLTGLELTRAKLELLEERYKEVEKGAGYYKEKLELLKEEHELLAENLDEVIKKYGEGTAEYYKALKAIEANINEMKKWWKEIDEGAETVDEFAQSFADKMLMIEAGVKNLGEATKSTKTLFEELFESMKENCKTTFEILDDAIKGFISSVESALTDAITSLFTMAETNAEILEEMAEAEADYIDTMTELQEDYNQMIADGLEEVAELQENYREEMAEAEEDYFGDLADLQEDYQEILSDALKDMAEEKEDYYDDLVALDLSYNRKMSDSIKDLARENEDYDIEMRRLKEEYNKAVMAGDDKRAEHFKEKMEDCTLDHERAVEDMEEKQEELTEDHKISTEQMAEDHAEAMDEIKLKKDEEAQNALDKIKEVEDDYKKAMAKMEEEHKLAMDAMIEKQDEEAANALENIEDVKEDHADLMEGMEDEMVTTQGIVETFWKAFKKAAIDALVAAIIKQVISVFVAACAALGPFGWAALAVGIGAAIVFANWVAGQSLGGEVKKISKSLGGIVKMATGGIAKFAAGGMGTDTVPAMLTPGEYVISKPMVDFIKRTGAVTSDLVSAIGSGARTPVPAFATGGSVSNPISSTYNQQRSYSINIEEGAIQIVTPKFSEDDAKEMFRLIEREASYSGLAFGRV